MRRKTKINMVILCSLFVLLTAAWFGGGFGWLVRKVILPRVAPRKFGSSFMIYAFGPEERFTHDTRGVTLLLNPKRANTILKGALPLAHRFLPPGIFVHGFNMQCLWMPHGEKDSSMGVIPLWVVIDRNAGYEPVLKGRMPVDEINRYLKEDMEEGLTSREKWILGHYDIIYKISFESMRILSGTGINAAGGHRKLSLLADGQVRIKFDDKPISARATAKVKELKVEVDMTFIPRDDKFALSYEARVTGLKLNVNNMLPWGDKRIAESLRKSLEKSLNRRKNKERAMKLRIPGWAARDMIVDLKLSDAQVIPEE